MLFGVALEIGVHSGRIWAHIHTNWHYDKHPRGSSLHSGRIFAYGGSYVFAIALNRSPGLPHTSKVSTVDLGLNRSPGLPQMSKVSTDGKGSKPGLQKSSFERTRTHDTDRESHKAAVINVSTRHARARTYRVGIARNMEWNS